MKIDKSKILETSLVLTTACLIIYVISSINLFIYISISFGLIGIFIKPFAKYITILWFKLAEFLNFFVSKIILGILFYLLLVPISMIYRISNNDNLQLKKTKKSNWIMRNKTYSYSDLENIW